MAQNSIFGQDPGQAIIHIQGKHDMTDLRNRIKKSNDKKSENNRYWFYSQDALPITASSDTRIDQQDLVFAVGTTEAPRASVMQKKAVPVTSIMNGLYVRKKRGEERITWDKDVRDGNLSEHDMERMVNEKLSRSLRFIGVALNHTNSTPDSTHQTKHQLTIRVKGTTHIFNNGEHSFVPGDTVIWILPTKQDISVLRQTGKGRWGRSDSKVVPLIVPLRHAMKYNFLNNMLGVFTSGNKFDFERRADISDTTNFSVAFKKLLLKVYFKGMYDRTKKEVGMNIDEDNGASFASQLEKHMNVIDEYSQLRVGSDDIETTQNIFNSIFDEDYSANGSASQNHVEKNMKKYINTVLLPFIDIQDTIRRRVVGTAVGYAEPGENLEIMVNT